MTDPREDPLEPPRDEDPEFAEVEAPPLESTDVEDVVAYTFAEQAGLT